MQQGPEEVAYSCTAGVSISRGLRSEIWSWSHGTRCPIWWWAGRSLSIPIVFDVVARAPALVLTGSPAMGGPRGQRPGDIDALRLMLKALIVDRFKLETHIR